MTHRLWIPNFRPTTLNALMHCHWRVKHRLKEGDKKIIAHYADQKIPKATGRRRVSLLIVMAPGQRRCDPDAFWKVTLDSLKACGLLVDDHPKWLEVGTVEQVRAEAMGVPGTWIFLEDIE